MIETMVERTSKLGLTPEEWTNMPQEERSRLLKAYQDWLNPTGQTPNSRWQMAGDQVQWKSIRGNGENLGRSLRTGTERQ